MKHSDTPRPARKPVFTFQCMDCHTKNKTDAPPEDFMLHCSKCGFMTVQTCSGVNAYLRRNA